MRLMVTRPAGDGERTAARLREQGHDVLLAPLLSMQAIPREPVSDGARFAAVLVTSANALRALAAEEIAALAHLPLLAVGAQTAEAARAAGFAAVEAADGDAGALAALAGERFARSGAPLLYLAAADRARDLAAMPALRGITVETVVSYQMVAAEQFAAKALAALAAGTVDGVLHFSRRTAEAYLACAQADGMLGAALAPRHYCLSAAIAAVLRGAGASAVETAERPDEETLLRLVKR